MSSLIYALVDPRTRLVRYVGLSGRGLKRAHEHRSPHRLKQNTYKNAWIRSLIRTGLDYEVALLEEIASSDRIALQQAERFWIAYGRCLGWPLTNLTAGGDGLIDPSEDVRRRIGEAAKGRRVTPETRARLSAAHKGKPKSEAHRQTLVGRPVSPETRAKIASSLAGGRRSAESRKRMSDAGRRRLGLPPKS